MFGTCALIRVIFQFERRGEQPNLFTISMSSAKDNSRAASDVFKANDAHCILREFTYFQRLIRSEKMAVNFSPRRVLIGCINVARGGSIRAMIMNVIGHAYV